MRVSAPSLDVYIGSLALVAHSYLNLKSGIHMVKQNAWTRYVQTIYSFMQYSGLIRIRYPPRQKLKESAQHLKLRPDDFEGILVGLGFSPAEHLGTTGEGGT